MKLRCCSLADKQVKIHFNPNFIINLKQIFVNKFDNPSKRPIKLSKYFFIKFGAYTDNTVILTLYCHFK